MNTQKEELEKENVVNTTSGEPTTETPKKKLRRGVTNEVRATTRLKFDERRDMNRTNGLFVGHLDNVEVQWVTIGDDVQALPQFAGCAIPILVFTFASNHENVDQRRYVTHRFMPAESNALTIPNAKESWKVDSVMSWMKHVLNVFVLKGRPMTEEEEDALTLPFSDFDENYQYVPVEPTEVIAGWRSVFENFVKMLDNNGKPYYKSANNGILPIWMKLLRFTKVNKEWKAVINGKSTYGDLGFTNFVGEGCIELYKQDTPPTLKIDVTKESVTYKETKKDVAKPNIAAGAGTIPGVMPGTMAVPVSPMMNDNGAFDAGGQSGPSQVFDVDDLPF